MTRLASIALIAAALLAGCGAPSEVDETTSPLSIVVGTHRAIGSYTCRVSAFETITWMVSTRLYVAQTVQPGYWDLNLFNDTSATKGITLDRNNPLNVEGRDNGSVVYNAPAATVYLHHIAPFEAYEFSHDETIGYAAMQVTQPSSAHPYGQLFVVMDPSGASDPAKGECASRVVATMDIQSS